MRLVPTPEAAQSAAKNATTLLTSDQVAKELSVAPRTVEQWRQARRGPRYVLLGRAVRYRRCDIEAWLAACVIEPAK